MHADDVHIEEEVFAVEPDDFSFDAPGSPSKLSRQSQT